MAEEHGSKNTPEGDTMIPSLRSSSYPPTRTLKFGSPTSIAPSRALFFLDRRPENSLFDNTSPRKISIPKAGSTPAEAVAQSGRATTTASSLLSTSRTAETSTPSGKLTTDTRGNGGPSKTCENLMQQPLTPLSSFRFVPSSPFTVGTTLPPNSSSDPAADSSQSTGFFAFRSSSLVPSSTGRSRSTSASSAAAPKRFKPAVNLSSNNQTGICNAFGSPAPKRINFAGNATGIATNGLSGSANVFGSAAALATSSGGSQSRAAKDKEYQPAAPGKRVSRPKLFKSGDDFVTFLIGKEGSEKKFLIHKSFACHYSPILKRVLGSSEESPVVHHIKDTSEEAFSLLYQWIYEQALDDAWDSEVNNQQAAHLIIELYTLAEKLRIPRLQNLAIEYFEEVLSRPIDRIDNLVSYCWENTKAGSPLRRLFVDLQTWDVGKDELVGRVKQMPREVLEDMVLSLKDRCEKQSSSLSMHVRNIADFYANDME